jgi:hypothetical protein
VRLASAVGVSACLVQRNFQRRKVAIGDCGRSYDTPCIHEHSCLRCPLLRPDPAARARLEEIRDNLLDRIAEAESHRWYGEAEGLSGPARKFVGGRVQAARGWMGLCSR